MIFDTTNRARKVVATVLATGIGVPAAGAWPPPRARRPSPAKQVRAAPGSSTVPRLMHGLGIVDQMDGASRGR